MVEILSLPKEEKNAKKLNDLISEEKDKEIFEQVQ